jgi:hypothetical protein
MCGRSCYEECRSHHGRGSPEALDGRHRGGAYSWRSPRRGHVLLERRARARIDDIVIKRPSWAAAGTDSSKRLGQVATCGTDRSQLGLDPLAIPVRQELIPDIRCVRTPTLQRAIVGTIDGASTGAGIGESGALGGSRCCGRATNAAMRSATVGHSGRVRSCPRPSITTSSAPGIASAVACRRSRR